MRYCFNCGKELSDTAKFCSKCGQAQNSAPAQVAQTQATPSQAMPAQTTQVQTIPVQVIPAQIIPPKKHGLRNFIIVILILLIAAPTTAFLLLHKSDEEKIEERLKTFETAYTSGDLDGCVACLNSRSRNVINGIGSIGSQIGIGIKTPNGLGINLGGDLLNGLFSLGVAAGDEEVSFKIKSIDIDDESATVTVEFWTNGDGVFTETSEEMSLEMVKESNEWYDFWSNDWYIVIDEFGY